MSYERTELDTIMAAGLVYHAGGYLDEEIAKDCESPIELRFALAFSLFMALIEGRPWPKKFENVEPRPRVIIEPQAKFGQYRADFLIYYAGTPTRQCGIVVECDGHEFHEKTKEQAARDKARDRALQSRWAKVLRFTGSEIHRKPFECASEAFGALDSVYCDWGGGK